MRSGLARVRLIIQTPADAQDATGANNPGWKDAATVWARVDPLGGGEHHDTGDTTMLHATHKVTYRWKAYPGLTGRERFNYRGRIFNVANVMAVTGIRQEMTCLAAEQL